jgi:hypothetical protein
MMRYRGCWQRAVLGAAVALLLAVWTLAQGPVKGAAQEAKSDQKPGKSREPAPPAKGDKKPDPEQEAQAKNEFNKQVNQAIDGGVKYLRGLQKADGSWQHVGGTALAGLALLEAGVPPSDEAVRKAAAYVRRLSIQEAYQYNVSLAVMFLDRLGDPQDEPFIQALAIRLLSGQIRHGTGQAGGWAYYIRGPQPGEVERLTACLRTRKDPADQPKPAKEAKEKTLQRPKAVPRELLAQIDAIYRAPKPVGGITVADNSNTQFALLALWVARRHGIPVERALELAEQRFRSTQHANGGWTYQTAPPGIPLATNPQDANPTPQMTCVGLIGLGLAHGSSTKEKDISRDTAILKGMHALAGSIGTPAANAKAAPRLPHNNQNKVYYTLWSLERTAVLYDLKTIGGKDWYKWGAQLLLANQKDDGSWAGAYTSGGHDTCFAILFLKRANLTSDLTERMRKDPNRPRLLEGIEEKKGAKPSGGKSSRLSPTWRGEGAAPAAGYSVSARPPAAPLLGRPLAGGVCYHRVTFPFSVSATAKERA